MYKPVTECAAAEFLVRLPGPHEVWGTVSVGRCIWSWTYWKLLLAGSHSGCFRACAAWACQDSSMWVQSLLWGTRASKVLHLQDAIKANFMCLDACMVEGISWKTVRVFWENVWECKYGCVIVASTANICWPTYKNNPIRSTPLQRFGIVLYRALKTIHLANILQVSCTEIYCVR